MTFSLRLVYPLFFYSFLQEIRTPLTPFAYTAKHHVHKQNDPICVDDHIKSKLLLYCNYIMSSYCHAVFMLSSFL